eukprot:CAMPEP_0115529738 /NCGR_PEP_ID=MMETSP0271-20121206/84117_1 /TAXON_ID=71861 /ORGANISM="Scrippsiella trochoidea, Strain CCMP3099" /LENGTH=346 /DNA_ID=CAMNT_0002961811 /DNA_START=85 /DNA_END=1124 /DNA_ORIENTATION=+
MLGLPDLEEHLLHEVLHHLSASDLAPYRTASRDVLQVTSSPCLWFRLYCTAFRGHFTPPPTFRELEAGVLPELHMECFSYRARLQAAHRLRGGHMKIEDAPAERTGMIDVEHVGFGGSFFTMQQCMVLQQPMTCLPLARGISYMELMVHGGASVGLVSGADYNRSAHVGWDAGSIGYHGDDGSIFAGHGMRSYKFGPSFGLDPQLVVCNDSTRAPRKADVVGVGIDFGGSRRVGKARGFGRDSQGAPVENAPNAGPTLFFTKNGEMVGSMALPSAKMQYLAFAPAASTSDVEAYSQQPRPPVTLHEVVAHPGDVSVSDASLSPEQSSVESDMLDEHNLSDASDQSP